MICHGWWLTLERSAQGQHISGLVHMLPVERFIKSFSFLEQSLFREQQIVRKWAHLTLVISLDN